MLAINVTTKYLHYFPIMFIFHTFVMGLHQITSTNGLAALHIVSLSSYRFILL